VNDDLKHIIEGLLFVSGSPLSIRRMAEVLETEDIAAVKAAVDKLIDEYEQRRGGFYLTAVAGGYQLRTRPEHKEWIQRLRQSGPTRLSKAAMETLAVVAYKQPVLRSDIEHIRGVDCGGILRVLLERKIIKILGRKEMPGRPLLYGTTRKFLEMFNLKDLRDLPTPKELAPEKSGTAAGTAEGSDRQESAEAAADNGPGEAPAPAPNPIDPGTDAPVNTDLSEHLPMIIESPSRAPHGKPGLKPDIEQDETPDDAPPDIDPSDLPDNGNPQKNT